MNCDDQELDITRLNRKKIKYTRLEADNKGLTSKQFKDFYNDYCEMYDIMCDYMRKYNDLEYYVEKHVENKNVW